MQAFISSAAFSLHFLLFGLASPLSAFPLSSVAEVSAFRLFLHVGLSFTVFRGLALATGEAGLSSFSDRGELFGVPPGLPPNLRIKPQSRTDFCSWSQRLNVRLSQIAPYLCQDLVLRESSPGISISNCSNKLLLLLFFASVDVLEASSMSSVDLIFFPDLFLFELFESSSAWSDFIWLVLQKN